MGPGHSLALLSFFNYLYTSGYPAQWHTGIVLPIPKSNQRPTAKSSFRPITLTECLSKVLGKMINRRLQSFLEIISLSPLIRVVFVLVIALLMVFHVWNLLHDRSS